MFARSMEMLKQVLFSLQCYMFLRLTTAVNVEFYPRCQGSQVFVTLAENVNLIIDGEKATIPACYVKFTSAHLDTKLKYKFTQFNLISGDVTISAASGKDNILWKKATYDKRVPPSLEEYKMADDQLSITVRRVTGVLFSARIEVTLADLPEPVVQLHEGAIVGIVFGCLVFVNVMAIVGGLTYKKIKLKKKMKQIQPKLTSIVNTKPDNFINRNTMSNTGTDERIMSHLRPDRPESKLSVLSTNTRPPIDLVAKFLTSRKSSFIREQPIKKPASAKERSVKKPFPASEKPIKRPSTAWEHPAPHSWKHIARYSPSSKSVHTGYANLDRSSRKVAPLPEGYDREQHATTGNIQPSPAPSQMGRLSVWASRTFSPNNQTTRNNFTFREYPRKRRASDRDELFEAAE